MTGRNLALYLLSPTVYLLAAALPAAADVTDRIARTVPLPPGSPLSLQITNGRVQITGWARPEAAIEIVRRAPDGARLARVPALIDTSGGGVTIRAVQVDDGRDADVRTDVTLRVPSGAVLRDIAVFEGSLDLEGLTGECTARVERGAITARAISGAVRLETAMGGITLERATLSPGGVMRLRTFNGDVTVSLAARPDHARVLALSMGGTIESDLPLNRQERWGPRFGETTLGSGEPVLSIDVVNGNIAIRLP